MKKTLQEVIEKYNLNVCITPNQNIILCDIRQAWKRPITTALAQGGLLVRCQLKYCDNCFIIILWDALDMSIDKQYMHLGGN